MVQRIWFNIALTYYFSDQDKETAESIRRGLEFSGLEKRKAIFSGLLATVEKRFGEIEKCLGGYAEENDPDIVRLRATGIAETKGKGSAIDFLRSIPDPKREIVLLLAEYLSDQGEFLEAEQLLRPYLATDDDDWLLRYQLGTTIGVPIVLRMTRLMLPRFSLSKEERVRMEEALSHYQSAEGDIRESERTGMKLAFWTNYGAFSSVLGRHADAVRAAESARELDPNDSKALQNLHAAYCENGDFFSGVKVAEQLLARNPTEDTWKRLVVAQGNSGQHDRASESIDRWKEEYPDPQEEFYSVAAAVYFAAGRLSDAETVIDEGLSKYPKSALILLEKGKIFSRSDRPDAAEKCFKTAERYAGVGIAYVVRQEVGMFYFLRGQWKEACDRFLRDDEDPLNCPSITQHCISLYNLGRLADCRDLLESIFSQGAEEKALIFELAGLIHYRLNDLGQALRFTEKALRLEPSRDRFGRVIELHHRMGHSDQAVEEALNAVRFFPDDSHLRVVASGATFVTGRYIEALEHAERAVTIDPEDINGHRALIQAALFSKDVELSREQKESVQSSLKLMAEREGSGVHMVKLDPELEKLKNLVKERGEYVQRLVDLYNDGRIPICSVSELANTHYIDIWAAAVAGDFDGFTMANGSREEQDGERMVAENQESVSVDLTSLVTLCFLGQLHFLPLVFKNVRVPWATFEYLREEGERLIVTKPEGSLSYRDGKFLYSKHSNREIRWKEDFIHTILEFLESPDVELVGLNPKDLKKGEYDEKWVTVFGDVFSTTIYHTRSHGGAYYCDDLRLRQGVKKEVNPNVFCTQAFLRNALQRGELGPLDYEDSILELIGANYKFVSESAKTLWRSLERAEFEIDDVTKRLISRVREDYINRPMAARILGQFCARVWFEMANRGVGRTSVVAEVAETLVSFSEEEFDTVVENFLYGAIGEVNHFPEMIIGVFLEMTKGGILSMDQRRIFRGTIEALFGIIGRIATAHGWPEYLVRRYLNVSDVWAMQERLLEGNRKQVFENREP